MGELPITAKATAALSAWWGDLGSALTLAASFGLVRYLQEFLAPEKPAFKWLVFAAKVTTSMAAGFLALKVTDALGAGETWKTVGIAIAGWGGADFINAVKEAWFDWVRRKAAQAPNAGPKD